MGSIGGFLVRVANRRGIFMFVDTEGGVRFYPKSRMDVQLRRLLLLHREKVKAWLISDAVTVE